MQAGTPPPQTVDELQASFLECLRAAGGQPLSFEQLRALGFENPATLCYELEMAEVPLRRVERRSGPGCAVALGVQMPPDVAPVAQSSAGAPLSIAALRSRLRVLADAATRRSPGRPAHLQTAARTWLLRRIGPLRQWARKPKLPSFAHSSRRVAIAAVALLAILAVAGWTLALTRQPAGVRASASSVRSKTPARSPGVGRRSPRGALLARRPPAARHAKAASAATVQPAAAERLSAATPASAVRRHTQQRATRTANTGGTVVPSSNAGGAAAPTVRRQRQRDAAPAAPSKTPAVAQSAAQLQADGHQLLGEGRYAAALADLRAAITTSGGSLSGCATPTSEPCLIYAYALFDLGRALSLSGNPQAAIGALEERLQIDNQRQAVQEELARVRRQAS